MKSHSSAIAILYSLMAVTQLSGCEVVGSTISAQTEQIDTSALAGIQQQEVDNKPGILNESVSDEDSLASQEIAASIEVSETTITHDDTGIAIREYSDDILTMDTYAMHIGIGDTRQIVIAQCPAKYADKLLFFSDNPAIATVDSKGNVKGIKNGSATITVTVDGAAGYSSVMIYVY